MAAERKQNTGATEEKHDDKTTKNSSFETDTGTRKSFQHIVDILGQIEMRKASKLQDITRTLRADRRQAVHVEERWREWQGAEECAFPDKG